VCVCVKKDDIHPGYN